MKNKFNLLLLSMVMMMTWTACKKDRTVVYVTQNNGNNGGNGGGNNTNTPTSFRLNTSSFLNEFAPKAQRFTKDVSQYIYIYSSSGNVYVLPSDCLLHQNNTPVTGNVEFELIEYRTKADMLHSGVTTLSGTELLSSGSMFYMTAYQNGEELKVKDNVTMSMTLIPNSNDMDPMDYWEGVKNMSDSNNKVDWGLVNTIKVVPKKDSSNFNLKYNFMKPNYKFGYSNLDCLHNVSKPRHKTWSLDPPDNCNDTNSVGMIIMDQYHACGYVYWDKDEALMGTYYQLPVGESYKLLIYRKYGKGEDEIEYVVLNEVVQEDNAISYKGLMTKTTKAGLKAVIDGF